MSLITRMVSVTGSNSIANAVPDSAGVNGAAAIGTTLPSAGSRTYRRLVLPSM